MSQNYITNNFITPLDSGPAWLTLNDDVAPLVPHFRLETQLKLKRLIDLLLTISGLLVLTPFLCVIALLVYVTSPGPVIYKSLRIGKYKRPFYMYKFRTMVQNAEQIREALKQQNNLNGQLFKLRNDLRITPIGGFLRRYSLDEFPQLFNVLTGDMSLVGPRPYVPDESELFSGPYESRFDVTPGMTGPWQVEGRSDLAFHELCELEWKYLSRWNLWKDAIILLRTIPAVLLKKGAY